MTTTDQTNLEVLFIDANVADKQTLLNSVDEHIKVIELNNQSDVLVQIANALKGLKNLNAIHIISHGSEGELNFANGSLNSANLSTHKSQLKKIGASLSKNGDILLYGCDVAKGDDGQAFINSIAKLTQADVAASDDLTGSNAKGGDWILEKQTGVIEAQALQATDWQGLLLTSLFASPVTYGTGAFPFSVTSADVNGDNNLDLIAANWIDNTLSVLLGNGDGTFAVRVTYGTGINPLYVISADVNGDNNADLIAANMNSNTLSVLLGNGNGTFATKVDYATGTSPFSVTSVDVNGDNKVDLIAANSNSNSLSVLLGNGDGTFADKVDYATGSDPDSITSADVNADGKTDLIAANRISNTLSVLLGNGDGTFAAKVDYAAGSTPRYVTSADVNEDNHVDLIVANNSAATLSVLLGNGDGTFANKVAYTTGASPTSVTSADVNGDNHVDLIAANFDSNSLSVLLGNGSGVFATKLDYATDIPISVTSADVNGDTKADVIVANRNNNTLSVFLASSSPIDLLNASDNGVSNADNITNVTTPTLQVPFSGGVGDTIELKLGGNALGTPKTKVVDATDISNGYIEFTVVDGDLGVDGSKVFTVTRTDQQTTPVTITLPSNLTITLDTATPTANATANQSIKNTANAVVQSTETGTAYLVKNSVPVTNLPSITSAADDNFNSVAIALANTNTNLAATGLIDGTYNVYAVDVAGNLSVMATNTVVVDTTSPTDISLSNSTINVASGNDVIVGALSSTDAISSTFTYSLVAGVGDTDNGLFNINGSNFRVTNASVLTGGQTYSVRVQTTDEAGNTFEEALTMTNGVPTLSTISTLTGGIEDTEKEITFTDLTTAGNEADINGTIAAFVVKTVSSGSLKIGTNSATATAWASGTNDTVDSTHFTYWTPAANANGLALNAFTVVAKDNDNVESATPVQVKVEVTAVNDSPTIINVPNTAQAVTTGQSTALADFTIADVDDDTLTTTLIATNGTIGNVTDTDLGSAGIQLTGTAATINSALAAVTFIASTAGNASIAISVTDGIVGTPVTATYNLTATNPPEPEPTPPPAPIVESPTPIYKEVEPEPVVVEILPQPTTKVFVGYDRPFTLDSGAAKIFGQAEREVIELGANASNVIVDQNVEQVKFAGLQSKYSFEQQGNTLQVAKGSTMIAQITIQNDANGSLLSFENSLQSAKLVAGVIRLEPYTVVIEDIPRSIYNTARIFTVKAETISINSELVDVYGSSGYDVISLAANATKISIDQNVEQVNFASNFADYRFVTVGNTLDILVGTTQIANVNVQDDSDGTKLNFADGVHFAKFVQPTADAPLSIEITGVANTL